MTERRRCSEPGCERWFYARNRCQRHYRLFRLSPEWAPAEPPPKPPRPSNAQVYAEMLTALVALRRAVDADTNR